MNKYRKKLSFKIIDRSHNSLFDCIRTNHDILQFDIVY